MKKYYYVILACLFLVAAQAQQAKSGTIKYPLTSNNGQQPAGIVSDKGANAPSGIRRYTPEGIVLTDDRVAYSGIAINDLEIDLKEGVTIEFEYTMASMDSYFDRGDGMTFFIFDAAKAFELGFGYEALGYAYNEANGASGRKAGLSGAYLAVGLDLTGGFKNFYDTNLQNREGISKQRFEYAEITPTNFGSFYGSHITLRGAHAEYRQARGYSGNPVLLTKYFGGNSVAPGEVSMATLDYKTGQYTFERNTDSALFDVGKGGSVDKLNFQRIRVELVPATDGSAMYVTVKAIEGTTEIMLIDKFRYDTKFKTFDRYDTLYDLSAPIPKRVKIGFSASTGNNKQQKTIIRNVGISFPNALALENVEGVMCVSDSGGSKDAAMTVNLFKNAEFAVDVNSFSFLDEKGNEVGTSYTQANVGKWTYSTKEEEVRLVLNNADFKPKDVATMSYVVSSKEGAKSQPSTIKMNGQACGTIANPQLRVRNQNTPYLK